MTPSPSRMPEAALWQAPSQPWAATTHTLTWSVTQAVSGTRIIESDAGSGGAADSVSDDPENDMSDY